MSYSIKTLPNERIIWETWAADFDPLTEADQATRQELKILNASSQPMVVVVDLRALSLNWDEILYLANHGVPEELNHHPQLQRIIIVTSSEAVSMSAQGMDSAPFGYIKLDVVASPEDALTRARHLLG
jgi:hypothetical protein